MSTFENLVNQAINAAIEHISRILPSDIRGQRWFTIMPKMVAKLICENKIDDTDSEEKVIALVIQAIDLVLPHMTEVYRKEERNPDREKVYYSKEHNIDTNLCATMYKAIGPLAFLPKGRLFKAAKDLFVPGSPARARYGETAQVSIDKALARALDKGLSEKAVMYATDVPLTVIISMAGRDCLFSKMTEGESYRHLLEVAESAINHFFYIVSEGGDFIDAHKRACEKVLGK
jgi:hypothetical protein